MLEVGGLVLRFECGCIYTTGRGRNRRDRIREGGYIIFNLLC